MDEERSYTLEETIRICRDTETSMKKSELQIISWLEELRDLRAILNERAPGEKEAATAEDMDDYDGPMTLDGAAGYFDSWPAQLPIEEQERFWLDQLLRARDRVQKDDIK